MGHTPFNVRFFENIVDQTPHHFAILKVVCKAIGEANDESGRPNYPKAKVVCKAKTKAIDDDTEILDTTNKKYHCQPSQLISLIDSNISGTISRKKR